MKSESILDAIGMINEEVVWEAKAYKRHKLSNIRKPIVAAACLLLVLAGVLSGVNNQFSPFVITAYAEDSFGNRMITQLKENEKVKLHYGEVELANGKTQMGYCFDLSQDTQAVKGIYFSVAVIDEDGNVPPTNENTVGRYGEKGKWAFTTGKDIATILTSEDGTVPEGYLDGTFKPDMKGKYLVWEPNDDGNCRVKICIYNTDFEKVYECVIIMTQETDGYYAEIT